MKYSNNGYSSNPYNSGLFDSWIIGFIDLKSIDNNSLFITMYSFIKWSLLFIVSSINLLI